MWAMIGTWRMALEAIDQVVKSDECKKDAGSAIVKAIKQIEDFEYFKSVGYGGLPNEDMDVELDAGYMDGDTLAFGAIMAVRDIKNPIEVAYALSKEYTSCLLASAGASRFARNHGFQQQDMLSPRAKLHYLKRMKEETQVELKPYIGHDTVGICALDEKGSLCAGTSTSGLFMKKAGRVGDSPILGSGYYADSDYGCCSATGLGEDLMKGCISFQVVELLKQGIPVQEACQQALQALHDRLLRKQGKVGDLSIVALDKNGNFGVATNIDNFSFVYASKTQAPTVYLVKKQNGKMELEVASQQWLDNYLTTRMAAIEL